MTETPIFLQNSSRVLLVCIQLFLVLENPSTQVESFGSDSLVIVTIHIQPFLFDLHTSILVHILTWVRCVWNRDCKDIALEFDYSSFGLGPSPD